VMAAILFCISMVAFSQFALYYWRATIAGIATRPVSDRVRAAAGISTPSFSSRDFRAILKVHELAPDLRGREGSFRTIRAYYSAMEKLGIVIPSARRWAEAEMATCSQYVAVLMDEHLERNLACSAQIRAM
jgi:hypothetical protein